MSKLICKECGGDNIETKAWVNANTNRYVDEIEGSAEDNWCNDCQEHFEFEMIEEDDKTLPLYRGEWDVNGIYQRYDMVYYRRIGWIFDSNLSDTTVAGTIPTLKNGWKVEN